MESDFYNTTKQSMLKSFNGSAANVQIPGVHTVNNRPFTTNDHVVQKGKLIIIPALGHQNKGKSSVTGSGLFVLMSYSGNNSELALQHRGFCTT